MKFLRKDPESEVLKQGLVYSSASSRRNARLRSMLIREQQGFCAYSEKYIDELDATDIEHFDPSLKDRNDDYYNYYAVISYCNRKKQHRYERCKDSAFFSTRFFQQPDELSKRIRYVQDSDLPGGTFEPVDSDDRDAQNLIEYLGWNDHDLFMARQRHIKRLQRVFQDAGYTAEQQLEYFRDFPHDMSYVTALEARLGLDLSSVLQANRPQSTSSGEV